MKPVKRRERVRRMLEAFGISRVRACREAGFSRTAWYRPSRVKDQSVLRGRLRELAHARPRCGFQRLHILLRREGWVVNLKRVRRLYRLEGLQLRSRCRRRKHMALHRGPALIPTAQGQRWSMDFVHDQLFDGRPYRVLTFVDQWSRESPVLESGFSLSGHDVVRVLYDLRCTLVRDRAEILQRIRHVALRLGMVEAAAKLMRASALQQLAHRLAHLAPTQRSDRVLVRDLRWAIARVRLLNRQITEVEAELRPLATQYRRLEAIVGVSDILAAGLVGHADDLRNLRDAHTIAMRSGTAPVPCSSGRNQHVRVNHFGDRELNRLLWLVAMVQLRCPDHPGRKCFDRKRAEGKAPRAAMRRLKRQLATMIFLGLREDQAALDARAEVPLAA